MPGHRAGRSASSSGRSRCGATLLFVVFALGWTAAATGEAGRTAATRDDTLVAEGEWWWTHSPDPGNPVTCATCHHDAAETRGWAAGFPKVRPLPPPHARVMTLLQANAEAVTLHYRVADPRPAAIAITAYLTALGAGLPISPGVSPGQPVFPERIQELARSVQRGGRLFGRRCSGCHRSPAVAASVSSFPRLRSAGSESLESFLEGHRSPGPPLAWDGQAVADLAAYLTSHLAGQPVGHSTDQHAKETP